MKNLGGDPPFLRAADRLLFGRNEFRGRGAVALVSNDEGQILVHLRDDKAWIAHPNVWALIGGVSEEGEDPLQTVLRELFEEVELVVDAAEPIFQLIDLDGSKNLITVFGIVTNVQLNELNLHEGQALAFYPPYKLLEMPLVPFLRDLLDELSSSQ